MPRAGCEVVGERSQGSEAVSVRSGGALRSDNAGMSSVRSVKFGSAGNLRFPPQRKSSEG